MKHDRFRVPHDKKIKLKDYDTSYTGEFANKLEATAQLKSDVRRLAELQDVLYAQDIYGVLIIFQAMDAAGKDGTIKHVMSGINPQGCQVFSFKKPSAEELDHDYLWRCMKSVPERGRIGIFNRSYYEEVLVTRVHPALLDYQKLPPKSKRGIWKRRFREINNYERYLHDNGIIVLKFFLNVSRKEQKKRFLDRINRPEKNWKFSASDVQERGHWNDYMDAYEDMFNNTSTRYAPWHVIPADKKWFARGAVAQIIISALEDLDLQYPKVSEEHLRRLEEAKVQLEAEDT